MSTPANEPNDRRAKAAGFNSFVTILRERVDAATFARILERVSPTARAAVEKPPLPMSWVEPQAFFEMMKAADEVVWHGRPEPSYELGRETLRRDMATVYKFLMHLASAQTVLRKSASLFATYSRNGRMSAREIGPKEAEFIIEDVLYANAASWAFQGGCIHGVLESAGTKGIEVKQVAGGGDGPSVTFRVTWK